jgi:hypothetical protein
VPVEVEDPPVVVERVVVEGQGLAATLNDLSRELLALDTLRVDERGIPRCRVNNDSFDARLSHVATYQLPQRAQHSKGGGPTAVGGRRNVVPGL